MTAIRTIEYTASPSGVKPIAPQDAGVRGEHKATNVVFNLDASLIKPEYKYRFEYVDGFSGFDTTEFVQPVGSTVSILLPVEWTAGGGCGTLRLCIVALDSQSNEEQTIYTFPASLLFAERETGGECNYKKGLSALIDSAGKATDAANEAAESANAAADKVDEAVSSANTAATNANRAAASADASAATAMSAAGTATTAAGAANTAASQAQAAKAAADTAASGANTAAEQARTAAASANTAAGTASTAASNANAVADAVQAKLDAGELKGEKGDTGPQGPQGVSGVYVGGGDMPEGYTVQVDPTGDMLCYTAGESDDRYANVLAGAASGPVAGMEDVSPTGALRRAAVLGATAETGEGDKGPDNPYTIAGVQPTKVTVCGKNLLDLSVFALKSTGTAVYRDGKITVTGANSWAGTALIFDAVFPPATYCITKNGANRLMSDSNEIPRAISNSVYKDYGREFYSNGDDETLRFTATKPFRVGFVCAAGDSVVYPQIEIGDTATPYTPYAGQTITLPALEPLYGDGTVNDEYDAVSGVETRRWGRVVFDGTETAWAKSSVIPNGFYLGSGGLPDAIRSESDYNGKNLPMSCSHFPTLSSWIAVVNGTQDNVCGVGSSNGNFSPSFRPAGIKDLNDWKAYLAAQYAAGTPVTVLYPLDAPAVTQHDPARILPPAPVCRVFADAGNTAVGYNRDVNIAFGQQRAEYLARIEALDARITQLEAGQPAEPMT